MKREDISDAIGNIDSRHIQEAADYEAKPIVLRPVIRFALPLAACFAVILIALSLWSKPQNNLPPVMTGENPPSANHESSDTPKDYTLHFNQANAQASRDIFIKGHFWEELTPEQLTKLLPAFAEKYPVNGTVHYSHVDGVTSIFSIDTNIEIDGKDIQITLSEDEIIKCYILEGEPVLSEIEGVVIDAGVFITDKNSKGERSYIYYADFFIDDIAYYVEYSGQKNDEEFFTNVIADIISGGKADLTDLRNPVVPELRNDDLTEKEAYNDPDFGAHLPEVPDSYQFNGAFRFINQASDYLFASWSHEYNDISFIVSRLTEQDKKRIVSLEETELYDISLYPIPWADSMPEDQRTIIEDPIFKIEKLTLEAVKKREYTQGEQNDPSGGSINMHFGVLYDNILLEIQTEGINAEYLYNQLVK